MIFNIFPLTKDVLLKLVPFFQLCRGSAMKKRSMDVKMGTADNMLIL